MRDVHAPTAAGPEHLYRVFIVEDSEQVRQALIEALEATGLVDVVGVADTTREALEGPKDMPADAAIINVFLRDSDSGMDILRELGQTRGAPRLRSMMLTNYDSVAVRAAAASSSAWRYFDKSMQFEEAIEALVEEASKRHLRVWTRH